MDKDMIMVTSLSDRTIIVNVPEIQLHRSWKRRGAQYPIERSQLMQAFYDPSVEYLFKNGMLTTNDKQFLMDIGLLNEETGESEIIQLTENLMNRLIKAMPTTEMKETLKKLTRIQLDDLADYAVEHYQEVKLDKIEVLSEATGRNIYKIIENSKASQEE